MEGYQKYVGDFKKVRLLCIGTLCLGILLIIYMLFFPMFTYEIAGIKGEFSLWENVDYGEKISKGGMPDMKDFLWGVAPLLIFLMFLSVPTTGMLLGGFNNTDTFAKAEYERIKEKKSQFNDSYRQTIIVLVVRTVLAVLLLSLFIWYAKDKGIGYFSAFKGLTGFGWIYVLLWAVSYGLIFYAMKEYSWIKYQIQREA